MDVREAKEVGQVLVMDVAYWFAKKQSEDGKTIFKKTMLWGWGRSERSYAETMFIVKIVGESAKAWMVDVLDGVDRWTRMWVPKSVVKFRSREPEPTPADQYDEVRELDPEETPQGKIAELTALYDGDTAMALEHYSEHYPERA